MFRSSASVNLSTTLLLIGAWPVLALLLGSLLPLPPEEPVGSTTRWRQDSDVHLGLTDPNPCTSQPAALDADVSIHAEAVAHDDQIRVDVEVIFSNDANVQAVDRLMPRRELFTYRLPLATQLPESGATFRFVDRVEVPLADRLRGSHLTVELVSSIAPGGHLSVELREARLECDNR